MEQSYNYNWAAEMEQFMLNDTDFELDEALLQLDPETLISLAFGDDGEDEHSFLLSPPEPNVIYSDFYTDEQPPQLLEPSLVSYPIVDPTMAAVAPIVGGGSSNLSVQSVAARGRRRRISEKTQELGRLIPGGAKMNTADMLEAGFKYVKFLEAQFGILRRMDSILGPKRGHGDLHVLLASSAVQERLSGSGMCLVPQEVVDEVSTDT